MEEEVKPHMVKQTITYSDGSETVINYRGKFIGGKLVLDKVEEPTEEVEETEEVVEETTETPTEEVAEEVSE